TILAAFEAAGQSEGDKSDDELSDPARLRVVEHGRGLKATDLAHAQTERLLLTRCLDKVMERFDVLAMPTVWVEPFAVDAWRPDRASTADDLGWLAWCRAVYPLNLTGQPAISVPAGWTAAGHPVGLHLVGRRGEDAFLLRVAAGFE